MSTDLPQHSGDGDRSSREPQDGMADTESRSRPAAGRSGPRWDHDALPERIGAFRILEVLGEGGMGTVYLAEQQEPIRRRVALKVVKLGMDTREVVARFEAERQALALMDHPNIAKVFEAGATEQGQPYFAMERVPGVRITEYCDKHRLTTPERLDLFMQVCEGIQHAHQKGIIHRDIKPSNVLVAVKDDKPVPEVIDFGVAKATQHRLTEKTVFTEHGQLLGTPAYMSPEQAEMSALDVDTRTDIYSLGVLLYELLVGALPFDPLDLRRRGYAEIQRIIREEEPAKPSTRISGLGDKSGQLAQNRRTDPNALRRQLRGDLDWIVMKAMDKDRTRRYATASEFTADIRRHLDHEPIMARPPSVTYRLAKFARKRRVPIAFAVVALVALAGILVSTWQTALRTRADQLVAERTKELVAAHKELAAVTERAYRLFLESPLAREQLAMEQGSRLEPDQTRRLNEAIADATRAIALDPDLAAAHALRAKLYTRLDEKDPAWRDARRAIELDPGNSLALRTLGFLHLGQGEFEAALDAYNRGLRESEGFPEDFHNGARLHRIFGEYPLALADHDRAVALAPEVPIVYLGRGITRRFAGDIEGAIEDFSHLASLAPQKWAVQSNLWIWEMRLLRDDPGDRQAAEEALDAAQRVPTTRLEKKMLDMCHGRLTADDVLPEATSDLLRCVTFYYLGARALVEGRRGDARAWFEKCRDTALHKVKRFDLPEFDMAQWHLEHLNGH